MQAAWRRRLATAHLCLSWLALAAAIVSVFTLATRRLDAGLESIAVPALAGKMLGVACLLSTCTVQLWIARGLRRRHDFSVPHGWLPVSVSLAVLAAACAVGLRGPHSRALLAGYELLLALVATIHFVSLVLAFADWWGRDPQTGWTSHGEQVPDAGPFRQAIWLFYLTACLLFVAALAYLESRPLPNLNFSPGPTASTRSVNSLQDIAVRPTPSQKLFAFEGTVARKAQYDLGWGQNLVGTELSRQWIGWRQEYGSA